MDDFLNYLNFSAMAEGLLGVDTGSPNLVFYFSILPQNFSTFGGSRGSLARAEGICCSSMVSGNPGRQPGNAPGCLTLPGELPGTELPV